MYHNIDVGGDIYVYHYGLIYNCIYFHNFYLCIYFFHILNISLYIYEHMDIHVYCHGLVIWNILNNNIYNIDYIISIYYLMENINFVKII